MRRLLVLAAVVLGLVAAPAVAQAGCIAYPQAVTIAPPAVNTSTNVGCTTTTGADYKLEIYIEASDIGTPNNYYIASFPVTYIFSPTNGYSHAFNAGFGCSAIYNSGTDRTRNHSRLTNLATGSVAITDGPSRAVPVGCP